MPPAWHWSSLPAAAQRVLARWLGTLLGVLIAGIALAIVQPHGIALVVVTGVVAWSAFTTFRASYALFSGFVAALVVLLLEFVLVSPIEAAVERAIATVLGGLIAILAFWIVRPRSTLTP
jgi:uncharacterized membrane protein YccC